MQTVVVVVVSVVALFLLVFVLVPVVVFAVAVAAAVFVAPVHETQLDLNVPLRLQLNYLARQLKKESVGLALLVVVDRDNSILIVALAWKLAIDWLLLFCKPKVLLLQRQLQLLLLTETLW